MPRFKLSPFAFPLENRLNPAMVQHAVCHLLTGHVVLVTGALETLAPQLKTGKRLEVSDDLIQRYTELSSLITTKILIDENADVVEPFMNYFLVRPRQNPAISFRSGSQTVVVHTSMRQRNYSPSVGHVPEVIEEPLCGLPEQIWLTADGSKTLHDVIISTQPSGEELLEALLFLTAAERQLIKLAPACEKLEKPSEPFNTVPRNFYVSTWKPASDDNPSVAEFHLHGIDDANWEFDWIEPTVNHAFRFPSPAFNGLSYGARFWEATATLKNVEPGTELRMLEVGGGTGSFARAFLEQASTTLTHPIVYHLVDISPTLFKQQETFLAPYLQPEHHYLQNAIELSLPLEFDLVVANEVIADFPVALVERIDQHGGLQGPGAKYVTEFALDVSDAGEAFFVNGGVFDFLRRAWDHLFPGGVLIMTEYGSLNTFPIRSYHLNHDEFSIHFGHVESCARALGFECQVLPLVEFLSIDKSVLFLDGQEEQILCLNHVLEKFGESMPYAAVSKSEYEKRYQSLADEIHLTGVTFSPLTARFHYGPTLDQFFAVILKKPNAV